jgi:cytochrome c553
MTFPSVLAKHLAAFVVLSSSALALAGCYAGQASPAPDGGGYHWTTDGGGAAAAVGVPCDVMAVLSANCWGCHAGSTSPSLVSYANLTAASAVAGQTVLQRSIARMNAATMPPGSAGVSAADIAVLEAWAAAGAPQGTCDVDGGVIPTDPYGTPTVCTSGSNWRSGNSGSWNMRPGGTCLQCHAASGEGPSFQLAGTVYPSAHEPADCNGANGTGADGAVVVATGANGVEVRIPTNAVGNFAAWSTGLTFPYTARVEYQGRTRAMVLAPTNGDCNACHTLGGTSGAPGRIMLP